MNSSVPPVPVVLGASAPSAGAEPIWRCFHCDEVFTDKQRAAEHFGTDWFCESDPPACIQMLTEGEKAIVNEHREACRLVRKAEADLEQAEYTASTWQSEVRRITKKDAPKVSDLRHELEFIEGRALAAEAALDAAPKWLAQLLRRRHERLWHAASKRAAQVSQPIREESQ